MGCIYSHFEGKCTLELEDLEDGYCGYDCDPDPSYGCDCYESDYTCHDCGADLNVEECNCDE